jgi:hypothetical protein
LSSQKRRRCAIGCECDHLDDDDGTANEGTSQRGEAKGTEGSASDGTSSILPWKKQETIEALLGGWGRIIGVMIIINMTTMTEEDRIPRLAVMCDAPEPRGRSRRRTRAAGPITAAPRSPRSRT